MRRLLVISGAGISVESGVKAFRTDTDSGKALWDEYDLNEVCNIRAFNGEFYHKTHEFYNKRREELATVEPNLAHCRIAEWYKQYPHQVLNITTNVDDLMERAGVLHEDVVHVHGFLPEVIEREHPLGDKYIRNVGYTSIDPDNIYWVKPNVVFFGELAPKYKDMYDILDNLTSQDMVVVVGCSNQVINFNWELFPSLNQGTKMVVINPQIPYHEDQIYKDKGVLTLSTGAVDAFSNPAFIKYVEDHLEGK